MRIIRDGLLLFYSQNSKSDVFLIKDFNQEIVLRIVQAEFFRLHNA